MDTRYEVIIASDLDHDKVFAEIYCNDKSSRSGTPCLTVAWRSQAQSYSVRPLAARHFAGCARRVGVRAIWADGKHGFSMLAAELI